MKALLRPLSFGLLAYIVSAVALWFVLGVMLSPFIRDNDSIFTLYAVTTTIVPLILAGYFAARETVSRHRARRIFIGVIAGLVAYFLIDRLIYQTSTQGELRYRLLFLFIPYFLAAVFSFIGAYVATRRPVAS